MGTVVVIGSSNTDMVVSSSRIPKPGETILGGDFDVIAGGKGANQAVAAARAGGNVTFVAKVGTDDFGDNAIEGYKKDAINTEFIFRDTYNPSGIAVIMVDKTSGENSIVVAPGANGNLSAEDITNAESIIAKADVVLIQLEIPMEAVSKALELAKQYNVKTILNPAPAQKLSNELLAMVDIITPNESETNILVGIKPDSKDSIKAAAKKLLDKVGDTVVITLGSKGVYFVSKTGEGGFVPSQKVKAIDATGAGDVFNGYLAKYIANGAALEFALQMANKAAAISVTRKGAQPSIPTESEINSK